MSAPSLDAASAADRLRLPADQDGWVRGLGDGAPSVPRLPSLAAAPEILDRLAVAPDDADEILAGWPSRDWPPELFWLLGRVADSVRADLGAAEWLMPGPPLPRDRGPAWKHFYVYVYLALLEDALAYHARHGVREEISWATLGDIGRNLAIDRRMNGEGWPVMLAWLTLHLRGGIYELGRLQFQRRADRGEAGDRTLRLHIPKSGPLTPRSCDESFARAREFFPRHFPYEPYDTVTCTSWLLDPTLADLLPGDSNLVRFQRRFELTPDEQDGHDGLLRFVFGTLTTPLDELPTRTSLQRALVAHLKAGGRWQSRTGRLAL